MTRSISYFEIMAAKPNQQILQIEPSGELVFRGPFTDVVTCPVKLTNPSDKQVGFKIKTTAPKQYCVRPNSGLIPPKGEVNVAIMLQPFENNEEEKDKKKHKFMVQSTCVPDGETSLDIIWKNTKQTELMDSKLRVRFEMPDSKTLQAMDSFRGFSPLFDRVLVEKFTPKTKTKGGIMKAKGKVLEGTVIAAGPGARNDEGKTVPMSVKMGDRVLLSKYGGTKIIIQGKEYFLYREGDILGRWNK